MTGPENPLANAENAPSPDAPPEIDTSVPSVARGYDYALGGKNNFEADRRAADALVEAFPGSAILPFHNRAFLRRGVRFLVGEAGIKQILDIGSGLPTQGNVHEIAHEIDPSVRVVYVDIDPLVLAHARSLLAEDTETVGVVVADATDPESILNDPVTNQYLDLDKPVAVLMSGLLHHIPDEKDPVGIVNTFKSRIVSGSYVLISNFLDDDDPRAKEAERAITGNFGTGRFRTWEEQRPFFDGLELVEPGFVYANDWRPDKDTERDSVWHTFYCGGIGRKP